MTSLRFSTIAVLILVSYTAVLVTAFLLLLLISSCVQNATDAPPSRRGHQAVYPEMIIARPERP